MRLAIFGGTFDPIHQGHLVLAEVARTQFKLDRVIFLPTGIPPHKSAPSASSPQRLAMVKRAIHGHPAFQVSDWEVRQKAKVYTVDTLAHFREKHPQDTLFFIVGSDSLKAIKTWKSGADVLRSASFLVAERPGAVWTSIPLALRRQTQKIAAPLMDIASQTLRAHVAAGQSIRYQVPAAVARYIQTHGMYRKAPR